MAKQRKTGDRTSLDHVNELERKAEAYDKLLKSQAAEKLAEAETPKKK